MITLERRLVDQLEDLAQEALRAMEAVNAGAEELIYTDSSLSAAHATLEELRSMLANPSTANTPGKDTPIDEALNAAPATVSRL